MIADTAKHTHQPDHFFQHFDPESARLRFGRELLDRDPHATSPQDRSTTWSGTTRFQSSTSRPRVRLVRSM